MVKQSGANTVKVADEVVASMKKLGISQTCVSHPVTVDKASPDEMRVAAEPALPESTLDDGDPVVPVDLMFAAECAAEHLVAPKCRLVNTVFKPWTLAG